jgi:hypothetical protein
VGYKILVEQHGKVVQYQETKAETKIVHDENVNRRTGGKVNKEPEGMVKQDLLFRFYKEYKNKGDRQA